MGKETELPKNIRQIGDIQGKEKIFLEDYVMTYIRKKEKQETEGYLGIFLGERQQREDVTYVFIRGILDVSPEKHVAAGEEVRTRKECVVETAEALNQDQKEESKYRGKEEDNGIKRTRSIEEPEDGWAAQLEREKREYFPEWTVQGCCVIGVYQTAKMQEISEVFPEAGGLIYHLQDQEETIYRVENERYRQVKGYFVFYEQNRSMQEYMADVFSHDNVEKEGGSDQAIKNFRKKVKEKGIEKNKSFLKLASSFFVITVLVIGAVVVNRVDEIRSVRSIVTSNDTTIENEAEDLLYVTDVVNQTVGGDKADAEVSGTAVEEDAAVSGSTLALSEDQSVEESAAISGSTLALSEDQSVEEDAATSGSTLVLSENQSVEESAATSGSTLALSEDQSVEEDAATSGSTLVLSENQSVEEAGLAGSDAFWEDVSGETGDNDTDTSGEMQEASSMRQIQAAYVIREGDTLADICNRYYGNLDRLSEICQVNQISDANKIMPGQKIVLP